MTCKAKTEGILDLSDLGSSSSTEARVKDDSLWFEVRGPEYHERNCMVSQELARGSTDKKTICHICAKNEREAIWARDREGTHAKK